MFNKLDSDKRLETVSVVNGEKFLRYSYAHSLGRNVSTTYRSIEEHAIDTNAGKQLSWAAAVV
jgi:hypothetical protein